MHPDILKHWDAPKLGQSDDDVSWSGYVIDPYTGEHFETPFKLLWHWTIDEDLSRDDAIEKYQIDKTSKVQQCIVCGKEFELDNPTNISHYLYCCSECLHSGNYQFAYKNINSPEAQAKAKETCIRKYGVDHIWKDPETQKLIHEKGEETCMAKYGVKSVLADPETRQLRKETMIDRYGVEYIIQDPERCKEIIAKSFATCKERYGEDNPYKLDWVKEKIRKAIQELHGAEEPWLLPGFVQGRITKINKQWHSNLLDFGIDTDFEYRIHKYSYDLWVKDTNILIEINPWATHTSSEDVAYFKRKPRFYHYHRAKNAIDSGYYLINVWDWTPIEYVVAMVEKFKSGNYEQYQDPHFLQVYLCDKKTKEFKFCNIQELHTFDLDKYTKIYGDGLRYSRKQLQEVNNGIS